MAKPPGTADDGTRREFVHVASGTFGVFAVGAACWPLVDQMNPSADVEALASIDVDLADLPEGESRTVVWRGKPLFIRHRTADEIASAEADDAADLPDPEADAERVQDPRYLVMVGVCTHLGCIPLGGAQGEYGGWFCPCHGSHYDTSGRIRKGPAPRNLAVPPYRFLDPTTIRVG